MVPPSPIHPHPSISSLPFHSHRPISHLSFSLHSSQFQFQFQFQFATIWTSLKNPNHHTLLLELFNSSLLCPGIAAATQFRLAFSPSAGLGFFFLLFLNSSSQHANLILSNFFFAFSVLLLLILIYILQHFFVGAVTIRDVLFNGQISGFNIFIKSGSIKSTDLYSYLVC